MEGTIGLEDGRTVGFATFGRPNGTPVIWRHGGPGSRLDPIHRDAEAARAGFLLVGVDRPGYGLSRPLPGRTIADWVADAVAVADELDVDKFIAVGESTGGAYALALAALVPDRSLGVVACCSLTDMRYEAARAMMSRPHCHEVWDAPNRQSAEVAAIEAHGVGGSKMTGDGLREALAPSDVVLFQDPVWAEQARAAFPAMFAQGLVGYTDDRLADGGGWDSFDVTAITCPVTVLHGQRDRMCDVVNAHHTAELIPTSHLVIYEELGHFSIEAKLIPTISWRASEERGPQVASRAQQPEAPLALGGRHPQLDPCRSMHDRWGQSQIGLSVRRHPQSAATRPGLWRMWSSCDLGGAVAAGTRARFVLALGAVVSRCWRQWLPLGVIP